jgi:RimJ/RimL family protein N-acetyltransferase
MHSEIPEPRRYDNTPPLRGRHVQLRTIQLEDYGFLYEIATGPETISRWRYRGATPSPEAFSQSLWHGVLAQFVIIRPDSDERVGLVSAYNADFRHRTAHLALILAPQYDRRGWVMEASTLFLAYLFETWDFRKIYYESLEFNYARFASGAGKHFHVEGCLRDHEYHDGRYWHLYMLAVYRDEWRKLAEPVMSRILADDGSMPLPRVPIR